MSNKPEKPASLKDFLKISDDLAREIKEVIYSYDKQVPLTLVIGVLRVVEAEVIAANADGVLDV